MQKPGKVAKSELLQENTGLKSENEELKNRLAQMEALLKSLQDNNQAPPPPPEEQSTAMPSELDEPPSGPEEEAVPSEISITFQAHHMLR